MTDEKRHKRYLKKRRRRALRAVLSYKNGAVFRGDYGFFMWIGTCIKASICLLFGLEDNNSKDDRTCFVSYDCYFNIDHYDWTSVFVSPNWFLDWKVEIVFDGE